MATKFKFNCSGCGKPLQSGDPDCTCVSPWDTPSAEPEAEEIEPASVAEIPVVSAMIQECYRLQHALFSKQSPKALLVQQHIVQMTEALAHLRQQL